MRAYILRRLLLIVPTLFLVTVIIFFSIRLVPGGVLDLMVQQEEFGARIDRAALEHKLGLDVPIHVQYARWIGNIVHGDLGQSLWSGRKVVDEVTQRLAVTVELGILAILVSQLIALPIGILSAVRQDTWADYIGRSLAIACIALPSFWLGTLIMVFPSIWWGWSPRMELIRFTQDPLANLGMFIIPAAILGMVVSGTTMRMTRTMILEVLRQDYIRTAWSKGLRERVVVARHALKNALIPVVTIIGLQVPILVGGSVVMEQIFNLPGMGSLLVDSLTRRDYTMLSGVNLFVAFFVLIINILVDVTYGFLDPRIRYK
jgi:peptide/nickel transport system permease protein